MQAENISDDVRPLVDAFLKVTNEDHRGTRLADEHNFPPQKPPQNATLEPRIHKLFLRWIRDFPTLARFNALVPITPNVVELEKISISGVIYARESSLPRDSNVIFRRAQGSSERVGRIKQIFQSERVVPRVTFLVVALLRRIADPTAKDTYGRFGFAGGYLCDPKEDDRQYVISTADVVCHYAKTPLLWKNEAVIHALPLNSVRSHSSVQHILTGTQKMAEYQVPMEYSLPEW